MLLGSTPTEASAEDTAQLSLQLIAQQRYSEAYELLDTKKLWSAAEHYNRALCLHWSGNFQAALTALANIQLAPQSGSSIKRHTNAEYQQIRAKQIQSNDHLQGMSDSYVEHFPNLFHDAIVRLQTDCWLSLGDYSKIIQTAQPIAHKGYKNITDALQLAATAHDKRI